MLTLTKKPKKRIFENVDQILLTVSLKLPLSRLVEVTSNCSISLSSIYLEGICSKTNVTMTYRNNL